MKIPIIYSGIVCPNCKQEAGITIADGWAFWLTDTFWRCPHCKTLSKTEELQKEERKQK